MNDGQRNELIQGANRSFETAHSHEVEAERCLQNGDKQGAKSHLGLASHLARDAYNDLMYVREPQSAERMLRYSERINQRIAGMM